MENENKILSVERVQEYEAFTNNPLVTALCLSHEALRAEMDQARDAALEEAINIVAGHAVLGRADFWHLVQVTNEIRALKGKP